MTALQTAITNANTAGSGTIELASNCVYSVLSPSTVTEAFPPITGHVAVIGRKGTVLRRSLAASSAFRILAVNAGGVLHLSHLTVENGSTTGPGGGIRVLAMGQLVGKQLVIADNQAANGGGLDVDAMGVATLRSSHLNANESNAVGGGAVISFGTLVLRHTVVESNSGPINGGGINTQPSGRTTLVRSNVRYNRSGGPGGGIANLGTLKVVDSSITRNTGTNGGGIASGSATSVTLRGSRVVHNSPNNCYAPTGTIRRCHH